MGVTTSWISSFADDTRLLSGVSQEEDVNKLQADLEIVYQWSEKKQWELQFRQIRMFTLQL